MDQSTFGRWIVSRKGCIVALFSEIDVVYFVLKRVCAIIVLHARKLWGRKRRKTRIHDYFAPICMGILSHWWGCITIFTAVSAWTTINRDRAEFRAPLLCDRCYFPCVFWSHCTSSIFTKVMHTLQYTGIMFFFLLAPNDNTCHGQWVLPKSMSLPPFAFCFYVPGEYEHWNHYECLPKEKKMLKYWDRSVIVQTSSSRPNTHNMLANKTLRPLFIAAAAAITLLATVEAAPAAGTAHKIKSTILSFPCFSESPKMTTTLTTLFISSF